MHSVLELKSDLTIGKIVSLNFRAAEVFKKYGIDFCCKGNRLLSDVCREKKLDFVSIENEILEKIASAIPIDEDRYLSMPLDELVVHIQNRHHTYVRESIPILLGYLHKINKVHGERHPELNEVYLQFEACANELTHHMVKEETILFPAIKQLAQANKLGIKNTKPFFFGTLSNPISMMKDEHSTEGDRFFRITTLTNNFTAPSDGCTTYEVAFRKLHEFRDDLFLHIHLENNILFPGALALELECVDE